jgi:hypothetical protein
MEELVGRSRHEEDEGGHALALTCDGSRVRAAQLDFDMSLAWPNTHSPRLSLNFFFEKYSINTDIYTRKYNIYIKFRI